MWGSWIVPPVSRQEKKKWEDIPDRIFWTKLTIVLSLLMIIGLLLAINM
jgi:hypothetical protein